MIKKLDVNFTVKKSVLKEIDGVEKKVYPFVMTTERIDRHGDIVVISEMNIDNFIKNNLLFFEHATHKHAIGNVYNVSKKGKTITGDAWFHELDDDSTQIERYVAAGVYKAGSVGFRVGKVDRRLTTIEEQKLTKLQYVNELKETELVEFSIVKIPSNMDAMAIKKLKELEIEAKQKGFLKEEDNLMDELVTKKGAVLNKQIKADLQTIVDLANKILGSATNEEPEKEKDLETILEDITKRLEQLEPKELEFDEWKKKQLIN